MVTQETHIKELLVWIENNLRNPLSLDIVCEKSGYSKWYLQRMFRQQTNLPLAAYIRARRLYLAAFSLRFTQKSILDISLEYQFDSQQTFSRCFKKHFSVTPREGANKRGNSSRLTQSFHFFMFEPIFSPVNALNQPI